VIDLEVAQKQRWKNMGALSGVLTDKRIAVASLAFRVLLYFKHSIPRRDREGVRCSALNLDRGNGDKASFLKQKDISYADSNDIG
jgi:hypothetical protein